MSDFFFWLGITLMVDYFQVVRMFLVISFFMEFYYVFFLFVNFIIFFFHTIRIIE